MLHILATFAKREDTLDRVMEFGGAGLAALSPDERATLANMATECSARGAVIECDDIMLSWIAERRPGARIDSLRAKVVSPDPGAAYDGRRAHDRPGLDPADGGHPGRSRPRRRVGSQERGPHRRHRRRRDRHRVRRLVHRGQARRHRLLRPGDEGRGSRRQEGRQRGVVLPAVRLARGRRLRARAGLPGAVRAHRRADHRARLRRVHRLRAGRVRERRSR